MALVAMQVEPVTWLHSTQVIAGDSIDFVFGAQDHADAFMQLVRRDVQNPLPPVGGSSTGLLDEPTHGIGLKIGRAHV